MNALISTYLNINPFEEFTEEKKNVEERIKFLDIYMWIYLQSATFFSSVISMHTHILHTNYICTVACNFSGVIGINLSRQWFYYTSTQCLHVNLSSLNSQKMGKIEMCWWVGFMFYQLEWFDKSFLFCLDGCEKFLKCEESGSFGAFSTEELSRLVHRYFWWNFDFLELNCKGICCTMSSVDIMNNKLQNAL